MARKKKKKRRPFPAGPVIGAIGAAVLLATAIASKSVRKDVANFLALGPHPSEEGWSERFDRDKELAQFTGDWLPQAPDELGCTWSVRGAKLTRTCAGTTEEKRLEVDGPGSLLVHTRSDNSSGWARYGYARIGDRLHVGPAISGKRVGDVVVLDDAQVRVVKKDGQCRSYRIKLGFSERWEREPESISCNLGEERFSYQTVGYRIGTGFVRMDTSVKVNGDALFDESLEKWPLVPKDQADASP